MNVNIAEKIKKTYDKHAQDYDTGSHLQRNLADNLVQAIETSDLRSRRVLDIGCGTGYLTRQIRQNTPIIYIVGCDFSLAMLNCAKAQAKDSLCIQSNAMHLAFADSVFDLVVSNAAYQWIPDLESAFKEARRVLKPEGKFYFTIFNKDTLWQLQEVCRGFNTASSNFPDKATLFSSLYEADFKIDSIETFRYEKYYKDLWQLLGVLKNIGCASAENDIKGLNWRAVLEKANDLYAAKFGSDKGLPATYEAFLVKATHAQGALSHD